MDKIAMRWEDLENVLRRSLKPIKDRMFLMNGRAIIKSVNNSTKIQETQVSALKGESLDRVQNLQQFGFASNPPVGSEAIIVSLGGNRENTVIIATEHRQFRFTQCASGESALYTDDGTYLHLKKSGQVELKTATKVKVDAPDTEFTGNVLIKGDTVIEKTLTVQDEAMFLKNINVTLNAKVTLLVQAGGYTGPGGVGNVMINVPVQLGASAPLTSQAAITTSGVITGSNVIGGGTNMATIKATFNAHTHPETGITTQVTGTPL